MTDRSKTLEVMAEAICDAEPLSWLLLRSEARLAADLALTAYESHLQAEGMAVVPVESADKVAALMDHEFHAGARAGWNAAHADNPTEAFAALDKTQKERLSILTASPYGKAVVKEKDDE